MGEFKFTCFDITTFVVVTSMEPDSFAVLSTTWVQASGILKIARKELAIMELAYPVGDLEEAHIPSLTWKDVWIKVACRDAKRVEGTTEVFINRQGYKITWHTEESLPDKPPMNIDDKRIDDGFETDEEDPDSQDSDAWLQEASKQAPKAKESGTSMTTKIGNNTQASKQRVEGLKHV